MYTTDAIGDQQRRCHWSLCALMSHCESLTENELHQTHELFGGSTVQMELHHIIGAQRYWLSVIDGPVNADDDEANFPTIESLCMFRDDVHARAIGLIESMGDVALNASRPMTTFGGGVHELAPAHIIVRTQTHQYQHAGKITAMCAAMGKPAPPKLDYPLKATI